MKKALLPILCIAILQAQFISPVSTSVEIVTEPANKTMVGSTLFLNMGGLSTSGYSSQDFESFYDLYDSEAANDVVVPTGQTWFVDSIYTPGQIMVH